MIDKNDANKLWQLIEPIRTGMIVTNNQGILQARPMQLVQKEFDGSLYFYTDSNSLKVQELKTNNDVCVSFSQTDTNTYISLSGECTIVDDKTLIDKYWNSIVAAWFPQGKDDASVCLIKIQTYKAEYWDATSNAIVLLYEYTKSILMKKRPNIGEHEKM